MKTIKELESKLKISVKDNGYWTALIDMLGCIDELIPCIGANDKLRKLKAMIEG